jgi:hypothetical protein
MVARGPYGGLIRLGGEDHRFTARSSRTSASGRPTCRPAINTIEDETSNVNMIVLPSLLERQRREAHGASLLAVY